VLVISESCGGRIGNDYKSDGDMQEVSNGRSARVAVCALPITVTSTHVYEAILESIIQAEMSQDRVQCWTLVPIIIVTPSSLLVVRSIFQSHPPPLLPTEIKF
jgi:hypothetical protein